jgi:phage-related protein
MSSFGGTVKLSGESEYRKALQDITSNLKVLNSEMKTVTSAYDKNDTSAENLSAQNEILTKKITEQQKAVDVLKDALAKSKEETGENSASTKDWQIKLNNAQAELNKLNREVADNTSKMDDAVKQTKEEADALEDFGKEADKSGEKSLTLGDLIKANLISDAIKGGLQALANGIKSIGSAMTESLTAGAAYADNILTLSAQTGLSTDTLEKYNAVAELTDVSMDTLTSSMSRNIKAMSNARDGSKAYSDAYAKLGVTVTNADGTLRDSEAVYWETIDALKGITNETERDALAMELFGKSAQDLNTIIEMGSEGVAEYSQKAVEMGAVLGGKGLEALGNLDDQMQIYQSTLSSTKNIIASAFAPAMATAMESFNGVSASVNGLLSAIISGDKGGIKDAMNAVSEQVTAMVENVSAMLPDLMDIAKNLISTLLQVIAENLPLILNEGTKMLSSLLKGISANLGTIMPVIVSVIEFIAEAILENLPTIIEMGIQLIVSLANGIADMLPTLIPMAVNCIVLIAETLLDNIDFIIDAAINIIMALADGLLDALPGLIDKIPVIIEKLIMAITNNLPKLIEMGITLTVQLAIGLIKAIPQLISAIPEIIGSLIKGFANYYSKIGEVGLNLVKGIWEGIKGATGWLMDKIKGFGKSILGGIKSIFGIHSPSTVFRDEIGTNLALGLGEGFASTMKDVSNEMNGAIPTEFDASVNASFNAPTAQMIQGESMVTAFIKALQEVKVVMDGKEMGGFITDTVERTVFA